MNKTALICCVTVVILGCGLLAQGLSAQPVSPQAVPAVPVAATALDSYWIAYIDRDGLLHTVREDGVGEKVLVDIPIGRFNAADPNHGGVIVTLAYNDLYWQIFNYTEDGRRIPLATSKYKNVFMAYDPAYRRVYYAKNYDEEQKKGDFYSVSLNGGASSFLARNAIWGDVIGDRLVFLQEWPGNKNIYSIRYNGTGLVGLATSSADESYAGTRDKLMVFTRLYNGRYTNLYAIPVSGGNTVTLDTLGGANKTFAGNGTERIYYHREYADGREVLSILPTGKGRVNLAGFRWDYWNFAGEGVDRVGLFVTWPANPYSVTKVGTLPIEIPGSGRYEDFFPTVFHNRLVFRHGWEGGWYTTSVSLANDDRVDMAYGAPKHETVLSWPSKTIIVTLGLQGKPIEVFAFNAEGRNKIQIGATHPNPGYLFSTPNRHVFAYGDTIGSTVGSVLLSGSYERVVASGIPPENLGSITSYRLGPISY